MKNTEYSLADLMLFAFASYCFHLGNSKRLPNLFIYPPDYIKADAPRYNQSGVLTCIVKINMEVWALTEISLEKQDVQVDLTVTVLWEDYRLNISSNISSQSLWPSIDEREAKHIWTPTILFKNCKGCSPVSLSNVDELYVNKKTEQISAQIRILRSFTCAIDLRAYPMDIQFCQIQIYTYEDTIDAIQFEHRYPNAKVNMNSNLTLAEYQIAPIIKAACVFEDAEGDVYTCLELRIRLEHLVTYHLMTSYVPTSFIVILSWISFWLPHSLASSRIALGLTSLLTLATRLDQAQRNLPPVAYAKAIDVWMFACIFLVSSSLCEFAVSHYCHEHNKTPAKVKTNRIKVGPIAAKDYKFVFRASASEPAASSDPSVKSEVTSLDRISRIIFPLTFLVFNVVYWSYYLTYYS